MHSTHIEVHKRGYTREADITYHCHHNGDYSGDITVIAPAGVLRYSTNNEPEPYEEVRIPFEVMGRIVADYIRQTKIEALEDDSWWEILHG